MKRIISAIIIISLFITIATPVTFAGDSNSLDKGLKLSSDIVRVDIVHYANSNHNAKGGGKPDPGYKLMGVKWPAGTTVSYAINPTNDDGLSQSEVTGAIFTAAETWDLATTAEIFNDSFTVDMDAEYGVLDNKNSIEFGQYSGASNVIAVTSVWYTRKTRTIVEFDMLFNTYYTWGDATVNSDVMDLQNIATHELGHSVGLADVYNSSYSFVTMYGYSNNGDISKRTLETPDISGLQKLYGN